MSNSSLSSPPPPAPETFPLAAMVYEAPSALETGASRPEAWSVVILDIFEL